MTEQEKRDRARKIVEALDRLPDERVEYILGYAEGVIAMEDKARREQPA